MQVALPYAALLLEKRQGHVGFVPATAVAAGKAPTDAEIATFYSHETARYTVPERREIGRASCRERVCQYVSISVVAVSLKQQIYYCQHVSEISMLYVY